MKNSIQKNNFPKLKIVLFLFAFTFLITNICLILFSINAYANKTEVDQNSPNTLYLTFEAGDANPVIFVIYNEESGQWDELTSPLEVQLGWKYDNEPQLYDYLQEMGLMNVYDQEDNIVYQLGAIAANPSQWINSWEPQALMDQGIITESMTFKAYAGNVYEFGYASDANGHLESYGHKVEENTFLMPQGYEFNINGDSFSYDYLGTVYTIQAVPNNPQNDSFLWWEDADGNKINDGKISLNSNLLLNARFDKTKINKVSFIVSKDSVGNGAFYDDEGNQVTQIEIDGTMSYELDVIPPRGIISFGNGKNITVIPDQDSYLSSLVASEQSPITSDAIFTVRFNSYKPIEKVSLSGCVANQSAQALTNVNVFYESSDSSTKLITQTDENGFYTFDNLTKNQEGKILFVDNNYFSHEENVSLTEDTILDVSLKDSINVSFNGCDGHKTFECFTYEDNVLIDQTSSEVFDANIFPNTNITFKNDGLIEIENVQNNTTYKTVVMPLAKDTYVYDYTVFYNIKINTPTIFTPTKDEDLEASIFYTQQINPPQPTEPTNNQTYDNTQTVQTDDVQNGTIVLSCLASLGLLTLLLLRLRSTTKAY